MYYDNLLKKCIAPAGVIINIYECSVNSGGSGSCSLINNYIGSRNPFTYNDEDVTWYILNGFINTHNESDCDLNTLFSTSATTNNNYLSSLFNFVLDLYLNITGDKFVVNSFLDYLNLEDVNDFIYQYGLQVFYYDYNIIDSFDNFVGGNENIISYENSRNSWNNQDYYDLFRKTNVYSQENRFNSISYSFNYIDNKDVSALLPEETDNSYLTSPFYKNNEESSSGGYITYNITNLYTYDDIIINYGNETDNIRDLPNLNFYDDFSTTNNIILSADENDDIKKVELSSDTKWILDEMYNLLLKIESYMRRIANDYLGNSVQNIYYNTKNVITETIVPDYSKLDETLNTVQDVAKESLGFVYEPFIFISFLFERINTIEDNGIVFHNPEIKILGYTIIPEMTFDFETQLFNTSEEMMFVRNIQLIVCNFALITWFINYFINLFKKIFEKDFERGGGN